MKKLIVLLLLVLMVGVPLASAKQKGGCVPCLIGVFFGSRAGYQFNDGTGIRLFEVLMFIPAVNIVVWVIDMVNIYQGKSWSNIKNEATLFAADFDAWHQYELAKGK